MVELNANREKIRRFYCTLKSVISPIIQEVEYNFERSRRAAIMDIAILVLCAAAFYTNSFVVVPHLLSIGTESIPAYLFQCHFNDFLGGMAFLAYANLLISLVRPEARFKKLTSMLVFIFLCGLFWEYVAPLFISGSVSDPLDLIAYIAGAFTYWLIFKLTSKNALKERVSAGPQKRF